MANKYYLPGDNHMSTFKVLEEHSDLGLDCLLWNFGQHSRADSLDPDQISPTEAAFHHDLHCDPVNNKPDKNQ